MVVWFLISCHDQRKLKLDMSEFQLTKTYYQKDKKVSEVYTHSRDNNLECFKDYSFDETPLSQYFLYKARHIGPAIMFDYKGNISYKEIINDSALMQIAEYDNTANCLIVK